MAVLLRSDEAKAEMNCLWHLLPSPGFVMRPSKLHQIARGRQWSLLYLLESFPVFLFTHFRFLRRSSRCNQESVDGNHLLNSSLLMSQTLLCGSAVSVISRSAWKEVSVSYRICFFGIEALTDAWSKPLIFKWDPLKFRIINFSWHPSEEKSFEFL